MTRLAIKAATKTFVLLSVDERDCSDYYVFSGKDLASVLLAGSDFIGGGWLWSIYTTILPETEIHSEEDNQFVKAAIDFWESALSTSNPLVSPIDPEVYSSKVRKSIVVHHGEEE